MKNIMTLVLLAVALIASPSLRAQEGRTLMATISSNYDSRVSQLWLLQDQYGQATGLQKVEINTREVKTFSVRDLPAGITLKEKDGYRVFVLRSTEFDPGRGGRMYLDYLKNGVTGSRDETEIEAQVGHQGWQLLHEGRAFKRMYVIAKKVLGKVVGVKEVQFLP